MPCFSNGAIPHHSKLAPALRQVRERENAIDHRAQRIKRDHQCEQCGYIDVACKAGLSRGVVLMDAGYGCNTKLRTSISALALRYVAGILPNTSVWALGTGPLSPKKWSGDGRPPKLIRRDDKHQPISVKKLVLGLPKRVWHSIKWREGAAGGLASRFARVRVRVAHRDYNLTDSRPEEWLLIEWAMGEDEPAACSGLPQRGLGVRRPGYFPRLLTAVARRLWSQSTEPVRVAACMANSAPRALFAPHG